MNNIRQFVITKNISISVVIFVSLVVPMLIAEKSSYRPLPEPPKQKSTASAKSQQQKLRPLPVPPSSKGPVSPQSLKAQKIESSPSSVKWQPAKLTPSTIQPVYKPKLSANDTFNLADMWSGGSSIKNITTEQKAVVSRDDFRTIKKGCEFFKDLQYYQKEIDAKLKNSNLDDMQRLRLTLDHKSILKSQFYVLKKLKDMNRAELDKLLSSSLNGPGSKTTKMSTIKTSITSVRDLLKSDALKAEKKDAKQDLGELKKNLKTATDINKILSIKSGIERAKERIAELKSLESKSQKELKDLQRLLSKTSKLK